MNPQPPLALFGPRTPSEHPSPVLIEQYAFAGADAALDASVVEHIEACPECMSRVRILQEGRTAFRATHPSEAFLAKVEDKIKSREPRRLFALSRPLIPGFAVAAALGTVAALVAPGLNERSDPTGIKLKGTAGLALRLHVSRHGKPAAPFDVRDPLRPGDVLRFVVDLPDAGHVALVSIDDRGKLAWYYPTDIAPARVLGAGRSVVLPGAIQLDDYLGRELLVLVATETPIQKQRLEAHIQKRLASAKGDLEVLQQNGFGPKSAALLLTKGSSK